MTFDRAAVERRLRSGAAAQRMGNEAGARVAYEAALALAPEQPEAHNALGILALQRSDFRAAEAHFARAAAADPGAAGLWVNLGSARRRLGDLAGERAALTRALETDQRHLTANLRLAELHEREGEAAQAHYRWAAVATMCDALPERSPAVEALSARARAAVDRHAAAMRAVLDEGLNQVRADIPPSERRRFEACLDALSGRRRIYANECHGLFYPFLPADEFFDRAAFPWFAQLEAATDVIRGELERLLATGSEGFEPYVSLDAGTPDNKWSALDKSLDWNAFYLWRYGERIADACARCPQTAALLEQLPLAELPGRGPTAFFSILRPRTRLPAHTGVSNVRAIVHLPLIVPEGCAIRVGGETRAWRIGEAFAFDDTIEHEAWNDSDALRAVLILDTWNPHLSAAERDLLAAFYRTMRDSGMDPGLAAAVAD